MLSRSNSKAIVVDGSEYRWSAYTDWGDLFFVAQLATDPIGKLELSLAELDIQHEDAIWRTRPWKLEVFTEDFVSELITQATVFGWEPRRNFAATLFQDESGTFVLKGQPGHFR